MSADKVWRRLLEGRVAFEAARLAAGFGHPDAARACGPWARRGKVSGALAWLSNRGLYRFSCELSLDALRLLGDLPIQGAGRAELRGLIRDQARLAFSRRCTCLQRGQALERSDRLRALARSLRFGRRLSLSPRRRDLAAVSLADAARGVLLASTEVRRAFLFAAGPQRRTRSAALDWLRRAARHHRQAGFYRRAILEPEEDRRPDGADWQRERLTRIAHQAVQGEDRQMSSARGTPRLAKK